MREVDYGIAAVTPIFLVDYGEHLRNCYYRAVDHQPSNVNEIDVATGGEGKLQITNDLDGAVHTKVDLCLERNNSKYPVGETAGPEYADEHVEVIIFRGHFMWVDIANKICKKLKEGANC